MLRNCTHHRLVQSPDITFDIFLETKSKQFVFVYKVHINEHIICTILFSYLTNYSISDNKFELYHIFGTICIRQFTVYLWFFSRNCFYLSFKLKNNNLPLIWHIASRAFVYVYVVKKLGYCYLFEKYKLWWGPF